jgi:hypothetical protein
VSNSGADALNSHLVLVFGSQGGVQLVLQISTSSTQQHVYAMMVVLSLLTLRITICALQKSLEK